MDYAENGDLYMRIVDCQHRGKYMSEGFIWRLVVQLARGLCALHDMSILHRDIKSANVFLCANGQVKLGDMNVSKVAKAGMLTTQTGTPYYASPEVWKDQPYDSKSDVWSLGCVLYEAAALRPPFRADDMQGLYKKVIKGEFPRIPKAFSQDLASLLDSLIVIDPTKRPSCHDILQLPQVLKRLGKYPELMKSDTRSASSSLLETIKFPRGLQQLTDRLPKPHYEDVRSSLPKLSSEESSFRLQIRRKLSAEPTRSYSRDIPDLPKRVYKETPSILKVERAYPRSTPVPRAKSKHVHELSLDSILTRPQVGGYYVRSLAKRPIQDSRRLIVLKAMQREQSGRLCPG